jgi:hypothetical protein
MSIRLGAPAGECSAIVALVPMLLAVALWNRFPLIYYDTGAYVLEGLGGHFVVERSPVYSLFLRLTGAGYSLWTIVVLQAIATAFIMVECARSVAPRMTLASFIALCTGLVVATGIPWYVGEVEPDCFAAIAVLAVYLVALRGATLGPARARMVIALGGLAAAAHASHLLLATSLLLSLAVYLGLCRFAKVGAKWPRPNLLMPASMIAIAIALVVSSNFCFTRQIFVSRAGPQFLFARLLQDRIVTRLLDETCPQSGYRLCAYKDVLPPSANAWLWAPYSPFFKLGSFEGTRAESEKIIADSFARYPLLNVEMALVDAAQQFVSFKTGDQVEPQQWALRPTFTHLLPSQMGAYLSARQQQGLIGFRLVNSVHVPFGYLSLFALVILLCVTIRSAQRDATMFLALVLMALLGNALICGALSNPHDRYQSRLIWIAFFAVILVVAAGSAKWNFMLRKSANRSIPIPSQLSEDERLNLLAGADRIRH